MKPLLAGDDWLHLGALVAVGLGAADAFLTAAGILQTPAFNHDTDLLLIAGGLAGLGVKIVNGLATTARNTTPPPGYAPPPPAPPPGTSPPSGG